MQERLTTRCSSLKRSGSGVSGFMVAQKKLPLAFVMAAGWTVTCSWRGVRCLQSSCQDRWPKASCHHREHHVYNLDLIQRMRWPIQTWPPACWHGTLTKKFEPQLVGVEVDRKKSHSLRGLHRLKMSRLDGLLRSAQPHSVTSQLRKNTLLGLEEENVSG